MSSSEFSARPKASLGFRRRSFASRLRDLRGGLRFYGVFIACLVLGVMAIVGVGATSRAFREGLAQQGATLLGGDLSLGRAQGTPDEAERRFLAARGKLSQIVVLRAMARTPEAAQATLVEIKAVDAAYPLIGAAKTDPALAGGEAFFKSFAEKDGAFGLLADPALAARLKIKPGDRLVIGAATFILNGWLTTEPDSIGGVGFGPRVMMSPEGLEATKLIVPGSLARTSLRLLLPAEKSGDADLAAVQTDFTAAFPDAGYEIRNRGNPTPQLSRNIDRFAQFLTLIGLTALVCGGVGVGNSIRGLIDRKRRTLAILKALGASGGEAARFVLIQALLVAAASALLGAGARAGPAVGSGRAARRLAAFPDPAAHRMARWRDRPGFRPVDRAGLRRRAAGSRPVAAGHHAVARDRDAGGRPVARTRPVDRGPRGGRAFRLRPADQRRPPPDRAIRGGGDRQFCAALWRGAGDHVFRAPGASFAFSALAPRRRQSAPSRRPDAILPDFARARRHAADGAGRH